MKTTLIIVLALFLSSGMMAQETPKTADQILSDACKQAAKEKKNVFIIFHASWCKWCHAMDTAMNAPTCKAYFTKNYVIAHLVVLESANKKNLENPGAMAMMKKHKGGGGIPFWLIFDAKGKLLADANRPTTDSEGKIGENMGCPNSEKEVGYFVEILKKTSSLKDHELAIIAERFKKK
jgi:thioredoxin-related protein